MEKRSQRGDTEQTQSSARRSRKLSEYGKQLEEKQKVRDMYGMRERQFRRFFSIASSAREGGPGENLLSLLERRLDNTVYRVKFAVSRTQARQIITHGHILVNGHKVYSPSYLVSVDDVISLANNVAQKERFVEQVIDKRLNLNVRVPEWIELNKKDHTGRILRLPVRADIQAPIEEHLIVELYSK